DRDGGAVLLKASRRSFPFVELVFADSAYAGERVANATCVTVQIVRKPDHQIGFKVHKRRWVGSAATAASCATHRPATNEPAKDVERVGIKVGAQERLRTEFAFDVSDQHVADRHEPARMVPQGGAGH